VATNTEKLQEILSGAQAVAPRIRTETPVQQIEQSVIDVKGGVDPLEVPDIGLPTKKKKQSLSQPSTGPSYSAVDEPLQSVDYGDPASFSNVENLLTQGTSFAESPQRFTRTGTISSTEGGDFFDDIADLDEFGAVGPDGRIDPDIIGDPFNYGFNKDFAKDVYNRPIGETFNQAIRDFGNYVEFGTTQPVTASFTGPFGERQFNVTDPVGNPTTPGLVAAGVGAMPGLAGLVSSAAFTAVTNLRSPFNVTQSYQNDFQSLQDISEAGGWTNLGGGVAVGTAPGKYGAGISAEQAGAVVDDFEEEFGTQAFSSQETTIAAVDFGDGIVGYYDLGRDYDQETFSAMDSMMGPSSPELGFPADASDVAQGLAYDQLDYAMMAEGKIQEQITGKPSLYAPIDDGPDTPDDPNAPGGPETGLTLDELESRMEDISLYGEPDPTDDPSAQDPESMQRDIEALSDISMGSVDPGDTFGGPDDPDTQAETAADKASMADRDEIESALNYDPDSEGSSDDGGKIICTAMNAAYGFGSFRQAIWLQHSKSLSPAYQKGYHALFKPVVRYVYSPKTKDQALARFIRRYGEGMARRRTADIWLQKRGRKSNLLVTVERKFWESLCYLAGKLKWK